MSTVFSFYFPLLVLNASWGCPINSSQIKKDKQFATCPIMLGAVNLTFSALSCNGDISPLSSLHICFLSIFYFNPPLSPTPSPISVVNISNCLVLVLGPGKFWTFFSKNEARFSVRFQCFAKSKIHQKNSNNPQNIIKYQQNIKVVIT